MVKLLGASNGNGHEAPLVPHAVYQQPPLAHGARLLGCDDLRGPAGAEKTLEIADFKRESNWKRGGKPIEHHGKSSHITSLQRENGWEVH